MKAKALSLSCFCTVNDLVLLYTYFNQCYREDFCLMFVSFLRIYIYIYIYIYCFFHEFYDFA